MATIVNAFPVGDGSGLCKDPTADPCVDNFVHQGGVRLNEDSFLVRLDHKFDDRNMLYARASRDISFTSAPLGNLLDTQQITTHPANYLVAWQHTFPPIFSMKLNSASIEFLITIPRLVFFPLISLPTTSKNST